MRARVAVVCALAVCVGASLSRLHLHAKHSIAHTTVATTTRAPTHRVLFVTAMFGPYEKTLKEPAHQTVPSDFIAFTDRDDLSSQTWQVRRVDDVRAAHRAAVNYELVGPNSLVNNSSPFNKAKVFKTQMHHFVDISLYDVVIWLDATITVTNPDTARLMLHLVRANRNFIAFEHDLQRGGALSNEVTGSLFQRYTTASDTYGPAQDVSVQYARYVADGFQEHWWLDEYDAPMGLHKRAQYGVWVTCFVAYDTQSPDTIPFLDDWWAEIVRGSTQDQVSFPYVAWKRRVYPFSLPANASGVAIAGTAVGNDLFGKVDHGLRKVDVLIIGAGPTGLGAAARLTQHGHADWLLIDESPAPGGLSCTDTTPQGFHFDMGGHVIFSHYRYFDEVVDAGMGGAGPKQWNTLQRVSYVWIRGRWVAYPFQNNIAALPKEDQVCCLTGLAQAAVEHATSKKPPSNFDEWILRAFGPGIADLFMRPYNFKVWACPPATMQCGWLGERVATVDVGRAIANVIHGREDAGWGPNAVFRFPKAGGTGAIWKGVAEKCVAADKQKYGPDYKVVGLDLDAHTATLACGHTIQYNSLICTAPLDLTLTMAGRPDLADGLVYSSTHVIGIGLRGTCPHGSKCWLYFPEDDCPFYRATVFSNYADANCPGEKTELPTLCRGDGSAAPDDGKIASQGPYWSLMFEVSESALHKPVDVSPVRLGDSGTWPAIVRETLAGAVATGLIQPNDEVVSLYHRRLERGYPTPSLSRDAALDKALPFLQRHGVWSRGRFGSWKYEVGNQDHSLMLGVEAVDNILYGTPELTLRHPNIVNKARNEELRWGSGEGRCRP